MWCLLQLSPSLLLPTARGYGNQWHSEREVSKSSSRGHTDTSSSHFRDIGKEKICYFLKITQLYLHEITDLWNSDS